MKTKIITAYWMDAEGYPFQSTRTSLKTRYQGSLISHCKGIDYPIICYTHKRNEQELLDLKENNNLTNLEIKLLELSDMKYHKQISEIRDVNFDTDLSGRGPEIMWGKFQALEQELDDCDRIYWIDCGLQHICDGKVASLTSNGPQIGYGFYQENNILDYGFLGPYPIGGLIGGDTNSMKSYLKSFWETCEKVMDKKVLCTEEAIMKVAHDENKDIMIPFTFDVYATNEHDHYHFELWEPSCNKPKPLYMVWHDILNYE